MLPQSFFSFPHQFYLLNLRRRLWIDHVEQFIRRGWHTSYDQLASIRRAYANGGQRTDRCDIRVDLIAG